MGCCLLKLDSLPRGPDDDDVGEIKKKQRCIPCIEELLTRYHRKHASSLGSTVSDSERDTFVYSDSGSSMSTESWEDYDIHRKDGSSGHAASFGSKSKRLPHGFSQFYELKELIGVGTTSKCYRCIRRGRGIELACKVIDKRRLAADQRRRQLIVEQLRQEVAVLRRLDHPNIVKLEDVIETPNHIFIVMEYMRGGELFDAIINRGTFPEDETREIVRTIISALDYMHCHGIVHRDVKPENLLLVSKDSKSLEVKLIDFGFSKILNYNMTTSFLGTGGYLAPEIRQQKFYSSSVDCWAVGVMVYLLLSGRLPFLPATELLPSHQPVSSHYPLTFPEEQWSDISSEAKDFIRCLLEIDPVRRFTTQQALRHIWLNTKTSSVTMSPTRQSMRTVQSLLNIEAELSPARSLRKTPSLGWRMDKTE